MRKYVISNTLTKYDFLDNGNIEESIIINIKEAIFQSRKYMLYNIKSINEIYKIIVLPENHNTISDINSMLKEFNNDSIRKIYRVSVMNNIFYYTDYFIMNSRFKLIYCIFKDDESNVIIWKSNSYMYYNNILLNTVMIKDMKYLMKKHDVSVISSNFMNNIDYHVFNRDYNSFCKLKNLHKNNISNVINNVHDYIYANSRDNIIDYMLR